MVWHKLNPQKRLKRENLEFLDFFIALIYLGLFVWSLFFIIPVTWFAYSHTQTVLATWYRTEEFGSASTVTKMGGGGVSHYKVQYQLKHIRYSYEYEGKKYQAETVPGMFTGLFLPEPRQGLFADIEIRVNKLVPQSSSLQAQFHANLLIGGILISLVLCLLVIQYVLRKRNPVLLE